MEIKCNTQMCPKACLFMFSSFRTVHTPL